MVPLIHLLVEFSISMLRSHTQVFTQCYLRVATINVILDPKAMFNLLANMYYNGNCTIGDSGNGTISLLLPNSNVVLTYSGNCFSPFFFLSPLCRKR
jgi:hypothetical protein